jgi:hypothetical protein
MLRSDRNDRHHCDVDHLDDYHDKLNGWDDELDHDYKFHPNYKLDCGIQLGYGIKFYCGGMLDHGWHNDNWHNNKDNFEHNGRLNCDNLDR